MDNSILGKRSYKICITFFKYQIVLLFTKQFGIIPAYLFGVTCKYFCAVLSGIVFFGQYAPEGFDAVTWSLWYNLTYLGAEAVLTTLLLSIPNIRKIIYRLREKAIL